MGIIDKAKRVAGIGGTVVTAYNLIFTVEGAPIRERDKPAKVKLAGIPVFVRGEDGKRFLFGIPLGVRKSR